MPSLMETIQKNMQQASSPNAMAGQTQTAADQSTSQAQQLAQATTGKAGMAGAQPKASQLAAQAAAGQANVGAQQLSQQAGIQGEQLKQQELQQKQQTEQAGKEMDEQQLSMLDNYANRAKSLLGELTRGEAQIDFAKQKSKVEFAVQQARLANDKYVTQLEMEGQRARLEDEATFTVNLQNAIMGDHLSQVEHDMDFQIAFNGKQNQWQEYLGSISLEHALDMSKMQIAAANQQMMIGAVSEGIGTATSALTGGMIKGGGPASAAQQAAPTGHFSPEMTGGGATRYEQRMGD